MTDGWRNEAPLSPFYREGARDRLELMAGAPFVGGSCPCYHRATARAPVPLAAVCPVVGELVPMSGPVTWQVAVLFFFGFLLVGFLLGLAVTILRQKGLYPWEQKRPDYDDL